MSLPDIDFRNIRPVDGSRHDGFEELCCQLASLEPFQAGSHFVRKGRGGDAGVECFVRHRDGTEIGWQAKYLFVWNQDTASQLDASIRTALKKHPQLTGYVVCLPFDLPDSRSDGTTSAREKWERWQTKWEKNAEGKQRELTITLWGRSELSARLARDDPAYSGRVLYWFGVETLTPAWFREQFEKARVSLGTRYIPETNVELAIRQEFLAFARYPQLQVEIDDWFKRVSEKGGSAAAAIRATQAPEARTQAEAVAAAVDSLATLLNTDPAPSGPCYPTRAWKLATAACLDVAREVLLWCFDLPPLKPQPSIDKPELRARHDVHELIVALQGIRDGLSSTRWRMANANAVLLKGPAGIGKSHLLADVVNHHLEQSGPAVLLLGGAFVDREPWPQIRERLDRPATEPFRHFLGALDAAAQAAGARALVCIDALNERHGMDVWPERLPAFLEEFQAFPRVSAVLSCRSTYVPHMISDTLGSDKLVQVEHEGFAHDGEDAASIYLDMRGIVRPGAPNMVPEFHNPLFLKTCCDALDAAGETELPKGLRGVTSVFDFYNDALARSMSRRMKLDPHQDIIGRAISGFAQLLIDARDSYVTTTTAGDLFESILRSNGALDKALLPQLESEGLLTVEVVPGGDGSLTKAVRFTFERYSDHAIASRLLDDHLDTSDVHGSFSAGSPLHEVLHGPRNVQAAGVIEAMAIQLPERAGVEIVEFDSDPTWWLRHAFFESLLWREQSFFSQRTFDLARALMDSPDFDALLISVGTEPANKFNARYLHRRLMRKSMPARDASWSILLATLALDGPVGTLISWATRSSHERIDDERILLAGTMLTWFLTTSHREARDKATKALACLLTGRLPLGARLLKQFARVNDPYVKERLLAACYGAALQGGPVEGLTELAGAVFKTVFSVGTPPENALSRDHALGILEYAAHHGALPDGVDIMRARRPYRSLWPIEYVPDALIDTYTDRRGGIERPDDIAGSTVNRGDFAQYVVEHIVNAWSPAPLGTTPLPTDLDTFQSWERDFEARATPAQHEAYAAYVRASIAALKVRHLTDAPETATLRDAEHSLRSTMTDEHWEDFRVRAKDIVQHPRLGWDYPEHPACFSAPWAQRWICKRAHELGWTTRRFGAFDRRFPTPDRSDHRVERIGKKYQWLALHELVARMADNLAFVEGRWDYDASRRPEYKSAQQVGLRDIDPSLLITRTHHDGWKEWSRTWWVPFDPQLRPVGPHERIAWLHSETDLLNSTALIDIVAPSTGRRWLALDGFSKWTGWGMLDGHREMQRDTWFRLRCFVVPRAHEEQIANSLKNQLHLDGRLLPHMEVDFQFYLGEYPWHPDIVGLEQQEWSLAPDSPLAPVYPAVATYTREKSGYDYSIDRTIHIEVPAPWLADQMALRMKGGHSPVFVDSGGRTKFMDPSILEPGPSAALVDRDAFLLALEQRDLAAIWVIAGEKSAYGGPSAGMGFGGRLNHTAIYRLAGDGFSRCYHQEWNDPGQEQLETMFRPDKAPAGVTTKPRS